MNYEEVPVVTMTGVSLRYIGQLVTEGEETMFDYCDVCKVENKVEIRHNAYGDLIFKAIITGQSKSGDDIIEVTFTADSTSGKPWGFHATKNGEKIADVSCGVHGSTAQGFGFIHSPNIVEFITDEVAPRLK